MTRATPDLLPSHAAKALLLAEMTAQGIRPVDLAVRLGTTRQAVNRLLDPEHATKIDAVAEALAALGKRLTLGVVEG
ncbi:hypothetical protein OKW45_001978 [Paraburkholderia sp. WSM4175]|uniref:hypothetical protein n=1 Tax=Paraburkholderia sp. WSM4175 TaxID=2991072 RepID=UPI003D1DBD05